MTIMTQIALADLRDLVECLVQFRGQWPDILTRLHGCLRSHEEWLDSDSGDEWPRTTSDGPVRVITLVAGGATTVTFSDAGQPLAELVCQPSRPESGESTW